MWNVFFEPATGWIARLGARKYGDDFTASAFVTHDGWIKAFAGKAAPALQREALRAVRDVLGLEPKWERYKKMASKRKTGGDSRRFNAKVGMEYSEASTNTLKARATFEYFGMKMEHINKTEDALLNTLMLLKEE